MSLSADQIVACNSAITAAERNVTAAEQAAGPTLGIFPSKEQRTAAAMRATLDQIKGVYAGLLDDSTPQASADQVSQVIANANGLTPGFADTMNATITTQGDAIAAALPSATAVADFLKLAMWAVIIGGAVYLVSQAKGLGKLVPR